MNEITITIPVEKLGLNEMISLHHELGANEFTELGKVRFCQHINGLCFWVEVAKLGTYQISTAELGSALLNAIVDAEGK